MNHTQSVEAAERHLQTPLEDTVVLDELVRAALSCCRVMRSLWRSQAALSAQYVEAARACGLQAGASADVQRALQACSNALAGSRRELAAAAAKATATDGIHAAEVRHGAVGATAGAIAARTAALPLFGPRGEEGAQLDAQLAQLAAGADGADDERLHMPRIPGA